MDFVVVVFYRTIVRVLLRSVRSNKSEIGTELYTRR